MERRSFIRNTGIAGAIAAGVAPAVVHAQAPAIFILPISTEPIVLLPIV